MSWPTQTVRGIPRSARTSRQAAIASRAFSRALARVAPWLTQPGIAGHSTIHIPSSSRVIEVTNFIHQTLTPPRLPRKPDSVPNPPLQALRKEAA